MKRQNREEVIDRGIRERASRERPHAIETGWRETTEALQRGNMHRQNRGQERVNIQRCKIE
jgi:hypothetical protein